MGLSRQSSRELVDEEEDAEFKDVDDDEEATSSDSTRDDEDVIGIQKQRRVTTMSEGRKPLLSISHFPDKSFSVVILLPRK